MQYWIYIALLVILLGAAIAGQVAYARALENSGVRVPMFVKALRAVNLTLLGGVLIGAVIFLAMKG